MRDEARFVDSLLREAGAARGRLARRRMRNRATRSRVRLPRLGRHRRRPLRGAARAGAGQRADARFFSQDMRELDVPGEPFDAVTCLFDAIGYAVDDDGVLATLAAFARHLSDDGTLVIEFLHGPALVAKCRPAPRAADRLAGDGRRARADLARRASTRLAASWRWSSSCWSLRDDGTYERWLESQTNRYFAVVRDARSSRERRPAACDASCLRIVDGETIDESTFHVLAVATPIPMRVAAVFSRPRAERQGGMHTFGESLLAALREARTRIAARVRLLRDRRRSRRPRGRDLDPDHTSATSIAALPAIRLVHVARLREAPERVRRVRGSSARLPSSASISSGSRRPTRSVATCRSSSRFSTSSTCVSPGSRRSRADGEWDRRNRHYSHFIPKATRVIVPNEAGRDQLVQHFRIEPERVLCLAHPTPAFAREAAQRDPLPRSRVDALGVRSRYLFYPAQFWAHKNHATLLEAVAALARDGGEPYELVLVGLRPRAARPREGACAGCGSRGARPLPRLRRDRGRRRALPARARAHVPELLRTREPPAARGVRVGLPGRSQPTCPAHENSSATPPSLVPPTDAAARRGRGQTPRGSGTPGRARPSEAGCARLDVTPEEYVRGVMSFLDEFERTRRCWA